MPIRHAAYAKRSGGLTAEHFALGLGWGACRRASYAPKTALPVPGWTIDRLDHAARAAFTDQETADYAAHCRWALAPVGGPYHWLVARLASDLSLGRGLSMAAMADYDQAGRQVKDRLRAALMATAS